MQNISIDTINCFARAMTGRGKLITTIDGYPFYERDLVFSTARDLYHAKWGSYPVEKVVDALNMFWELRK